MDARETLTIAGLEKAKERNLEQHLRPRDPQTWMVFCATVDQFRARLWSGREKSTCWMGNEVCGIRGKIGHLRKVRIQCEKSDGKRKNAERQRQGQESIHGHVLLMWKARSPEARLSSSQRDLQHLRQKKAHEPGMKIKPKFKCQCAVQWNRCKATEPWCTKW